MEELIKQFWEETSELIDAHRKNNDERAAQGVVDSRIIFSRLVKKLTIPVVVKSFYCGGIKKTSKEESSEMKGYEYEKWKDTQ